MKPDFKQVSEQKIWSWNFAPQMGGEAIAAILAVTVAARGTVAEVLPLTIGDQGFEGQEVRTRLDGGTDGESYLVTVKVQDALGQVYELEKEFLVLDLAWSLPDGTTPYLALAEFVDEVGLDETIRLTDELGTGRVDKTRLTAAIEAAQATADGYLASRYTVPLTAPPRLVKTAVLDLARKRLWRSEPPVGVAAAAAEALQTLRALAKGEMKLPQAEEPEAAPASAAPVKYSPGTRTYPPGSLDGFKL